MESANPSCSTSNREFLNPKKKKEIDSWLGDSRIIDSFDGLNEIEYFDTFPTLEELEYHDIIDHHLGEVVFGKPFARNTGLVYDQKKRTVTFEKDDEKITFIMPHKMEASNHIDFKDINIDSIPPSVLESNDDREKTYYLDSLTLGPEYREDKSVSKEIRHLMKLQREAKRHKGEVTKNDCGREKGYHEYSKKKSGGKSPLSVTIQDTPSAPKSKTASSKSKLKGTQSLTPAEQEAADIMQAFKERKKTSKRQPCTGGSNEGTGTLPGALDESTVIFATSSEGTGTKPGVPDEDKDITKDKACKDGDVVMTAHDMIHVHKDKDVEMENAEVEESNKGDEYVTDAAKKDAEKTSEVKDDPKKTELPPTSSSLFVSSDVSSLMDIPIQQETPQTQSLSVHKVPVLVIPETTNLPPIPETLTETPISIAVPSPQVTPIISSVQQTPTPIPT
ncbi:hypothetical protein Tco_0656391 [Tanacetum coccineum]|uniref:Uncharacterized protein n=1 Tax=Tanacetum coccineum TaxID=301880 RepID=A0ABQ4X8M1_9ASTR